ncbi:MAG: hypothetical protein H8E37_14385, partial [Planctomycetes bacterium]|nr:hypothetical protein [Planctomycetota bacterium]
MISRWLATCLVFAAALPPASAAEPSTNLRITLPAEFYAVVGSEMSLYFDNVVLTETPEQFRFEVACSIGEAGKRRRSATPRANAVGPHPLVGTRREATGRPLGRQSTRLQGVPADPPE